jgi:hypothetical protein
MENVELAKRFRELYTARPSYAGSKSASRRH